MKKETTTKKTTAARGRSGPFTLFPGKEKENIRLTPGAKVALEAAGERLKHEETGNPVGWAEIVEALARLYSRTISYADLKRAAAKR